MKLYIGAIVAVLVLIAIFIGKNTTNENSTLDTSSNSISNIYEQGFPPIEEIGRPGPPPSGYVRYQNDRYGFYFYHSPEANITEYDEGDGATTIVQENFSNLRGLQIFIVPYTEPTVSEERFKLDIPSGVIKNLATTTLGKIKVPAITFNSFDENLGETREIWFIHEGHLYEITTFKGIRDWLTPIIQSWRFTK